MPFSAFYHPSEMLEIQLAVSRDGIDWDRLGDRQPWIRIPLDEDRVKRMYASPAVVRQGNLLYHYYSAIPQYNGGSAPGDYKIEIMPD